ncbi:MAG: hypothetical protein LUQ40_04010 [Methanomicrobiales archaeon]|nr:hypothetical protein [Methanomicrobiales archaeon]
MVNDEAQLYTLEGIAAAIIVVVTMTLVLGTTSIYTPGDTHITDMQLEQLGSDTLRLMDTANSTGARSDLEMIVATYDNRTYFEDLFRGYIRQASGGADSSLQFSASVLYRDDDFGNITSYPLIETQRFSGREPAIRVTRWVQLETRPAGSLPVPHNTLMDAREQVVLVEVLLWRG